MSPLPLLIEPEQLAGILGNEEVILIDLSKAENYARGHIPGAIFIDYRHVVNGLGLH